MTTLYRLDDRLLTDVNDLARHTGWLHDAILGYATYGLVLFAGLMLAALLVSRTRSDRDLAAAGWSALATLIAVGLNRPLVAAFAEPRPTPPTRTCSCWPRTAPTPPSRVTTR